MDKSKFIEQLYFGTPTYLIKDENDWDVFLCLANKKGAKRLIKRYQKDFHLLIKINNVEIRFSEFKNSARSLYLIFLYSKSNKLFRFDPVNTKCEECGFEIYGGITSSFEVRLGIENKSTFFKQQNELEDACCPNCRTKIENIQFIFEGN